MYGLFLRVIEEDGPGIFSGQRLSFAGLCRRKQ